MDVLSIRKDTVMTKDPALMNVLAARSLLSIRLEELRDRASFLASIVDAEEDDGSSAEDERQEANGKIYILESALRYIDRFLKED